MVITGLHVGGGAEAQFVRLATYLAKSGWCVDVVTLMPANDFVDELMAARVSVHTLDIARGRYDPRALLRLVRLLNRRSPLILCTFLFHANVLGRIAGWLAATPLVVSSIRNVDFGGRRADRLLKMTDRLCDLTTTNSRLAADALMERRIVRKGRLTVVPNALDPRTLSDSVRDHGWLTGELGCPTGRFVWLAVGRLEPQKGYEAALDALARLVARGFDVHLAIAGEGAQRGALSKQAERIGIAARVSLLGTRRDVPRLMRGADALVLSSRWEGLPNVVMEALAARTPVVATSVGGVPELIEDGRTGLLVDPGDAEALADGMVRLMEMPIEQRGALTEAGRLHVEQEYALEPVMQAWVSLFDGLLDRWRSTGRPWFGIR